MKGFYLISFGLMLSAVAQGACPITECNYLDPQYQIAVTAWSNCTSAPADAWTRAMDTLAISYPKFGIAWSAEKLEIENATSEKGVIDTVASTEAHRRFEDRILQTAEAEALEYYNLFKLKFTQQIKQCGPMPQPPPGQPK